MQSFARQNLHCAVILLACCSFAACGGGGSSVGPPLQNTNAHAPGAVTTPPQPTLLYVPDGNSVKIFPASASGNVAPVATIAGSNTLLCIAVGAAFDPSGNLYVTDRGCPGGAASIHVFAPGATGNVAPIRTITGSSTNLVSPEGDAIDARGRLYVTDQFSQSANIFNAAADGNTAPEFTLTNSNTGIANPRGITLDGSGQFYIANVDSIAPSITIYAAFPCENTAPVRTIQGQPLGIGDFTGLDIPSGVALDSNRNIYVANEGGKPLSSIEEFASTANGNVKPIRVISGANTGLHGPFGIALDSTGAIYVSQATEVLVFNSSASGDAAPVRVISGSATGLSSAGFIALH